MRVSRPALSWRLCWSRQAWSSPSSTRTPSALLWNSCCAHWTSCALWSWTVPPVGQITCAASWIISTCWRQCWCAAWAPKVRVLFHLIIRKCFIITIGFFIKNWVRKILHKMITLYSPAVCVCVCVQIRVQLWNWGILCSCCCSHLISSSHTCSLTDRSPPTGTTYTSDLLYLLCSRQSAAKQKMNCKKM